MNLPELRINHNQYLDWFIELVTTYTNKDGSTRTSYKPIISGIKTKKSIEQIFYAIRDLFDHTVEINK